MEETKDFLTEETAAEAIPGTDTDTDGAAAAGETAGTELEKTEAAADGEPAPSPKKKKTLQTTILISLVIVICVVLAAIICRLFFMKGVVDTNLIGGKATTVWHYKPDASQLAASVDEAMIPDYYFVFNPDGTVSVNMGSFEFQGEYTLRSLEANEIPQDSGFKEGTPVLEMSGTIQGDGTFLYERSGNAFTENTLKLTPITNPKVEIVMDNKAYTPATVERKDTFTKDDALLGNWSFKNEQMTQNFRFNEDGTYELKSMANGGVEKQTGIYNTKDGALTLTYKAPKEQSQTLKYAVKDNKLSLSQVVEYGGQSMEMPLNEFTKVP